MNGLRRYSTKELLLEYQRLLRTHPPTAFAVQTFIKKHSDNKRFTSLVQLHQELSRAFNKCLEKQIEPLK